ncbi:MAG: cytochrome P460 family protein [Methylococcales bacterium]|nr:cytochrome P460 family protein [Methylococcales bacterium]
MKKFLLPFKITAFWLLFLNLCVADSVLPTLNGIKYPIGLKNWRVLSSSYRTDNNTQRVILGNSIAIKASKSGQTNPWPEGSILAKLVWKNTELPSWESAIVPGEFAHAEIMIKNSKKYKATGKWGYARWKGLSLAPFGKDKSFSQECLSCHTKVKNNDYVFTIPAKIP